MIHQRYFPSILFSLLVLVVRFSTSTLTCTSDEECKVALLPGSECLNGFCVNPFYNGGCLHQMLPGWDRIRTCNSDDPPDAAKKGYCRLSPMGYREVRIESQNWLTAYFGTWILQILLGELLDVPVTVESGTPDIDLSLYNIESSHGYGFAHDFDSYRVASEVGDCTKVRRTGESDSYISCSHVNPEYWGDSILDDNIHLELKDLGIITSSDWYIPKYTAYRDPSLVSYLGLIGEHSRRKLAAAFPRPFTWGQYCEKVSDSNCEIANEIAARPPNTEEESSSYFLQGMFHGYFSFTAKNDCDANPLTCTGHIVDYPCDWLFSVVQNTYHLNIALASDGPDPHHGYSMNHGVQIYLAANHSKTDVIILWDNTDVLYHTFLGTDAEMTRVILPPPTQTCANHRFSSTECDLELEKRRGDPMGACDSPDQSIQKIINRIIHDSFRDISRELWSPAFDAIVNYKLDTLNQGEIVRLWLDNGNRINGFEPRRAVCRWVVENLDIVKGFIPTTHPRTIEPEKPSQRVLHIFSIKFAAVATSLTLLSSLLFLMKNKARVIFSQEFYLCFYLGGIILVSVSGLLLSQQPTNSRCVASAWLTNLGYCITFFSLNARISATNKLAHFGNKTRYTILASWSLLRTMSVSLVLVSSFMLVWTLLDASRKVSQYHLTMEVNSNGEYVVSSVFYCASESRLWMTLSFAWQGVILLLLAVGASTRSIAQESLDSARLTMVVTSHITTFLFRCSLWVLDGSFHPSTFTAFQSILISADCISVLAVYVVPHIRDGENPTTEPGDAELFIETSIIVTEIFGFEAWCSIREPAQVFRFLEVVYTSFDHLAEQRGVMKVETSGGRYVAACGISRTQPDHALIISRFAIDCIRKMNSLVHDLETIFGPDTGTLTLRIGVHSGPVTGGYLQRQGMRFQLCGDTLNTVIQLVHSCAKGRIQVSTETAKLLTDAGKHRWLEERGDKVFTNARGMIQTYWLRKSKANGMMTTDECLSEVSSDTGGGLDFELSSDLGNGDSARTSRLIDWNVEVLHQLLKTIVMRRSMESKKADNSTFQQQDCGCDESTSCGKSSSSEGATERGTMPLDEVKEIIYLPEFDRRAAVNEKDAATVQIPATVLTQLKEFVTAIAQMYNDNPFHNFSHASHVVIAVTKFMSRIKEARELEIGHETDRKLNDSKFASALHDHTYGITSDPLTQFACVFSALIHDVDHRGVPNPRLILEEETLASRYSFRSVAEQNSCDLAWGLLTDENFKELLATICASKAELLRFRQIVINSVMATDLGDKELKELRNGRWERAFSNEAERNTGKLLAVRGEINRKATIVIEHLIQAADISHTTQHWEVYRVWNENLFRELYKAFVNGRASQNPAEIWYQGEIGFFDYYIIPLAKKLRDCGAFGLTSEENLSYALQNRQMWIELGEEITMEMLERAKAEFPLQE